MAEESRISAPSGFPIGNCKVMIEGSSYSCSSTGQNLEVSVSNAAKINISVVHGESDSLLSNLSFVLVNPKDADDQSKTLMQEALRLYVKELPTMNFAANTGKESNFLERCVSSGKYCTLLLRLNIGGLFTEVIAALTYQIIPADTQYAEVPLAAVSSNYQHKGIGHLLYSELKNRLRNVGICTVLCWGDRESEGFWIKQGFEIIAEVDVKGKVRKLPIKADIRRALCFPGGSSLMVSYLNKSDNITSNPTSQVKPHVPLVYHAKSSSPLALTRQELGDLLECHGASKGSLVKNGLMLNAIIPQIEDTRFNLLLKDGCTIDNKNADGASLQEHSYKEVAPSNQIDHNNALTDVIMRVDGDGCTTDDKTHDDSSPQENSSKELATINIIDENNAHKDNKEDTEGKHCGYSTRSAKRKTWATSLSSINSKKVKGGHHVNHSSWDLDSKNDERINCSPDTLPLSTYIRKFRKKETVPKDTVKNNCQSFQTESITNKDQIQGELLSKEDCHRIMLMDIADDAKKAFLAKIVEDLGGSIASEGHISTHVITIKARKTRNFCVALSSGAWIVSSNWLKQSFREGKFVDELPFMVQDQDYTSKYKSDLKDAVLRAKASPRALLKGYDICLAKHVQPPVDILSDIAKSAGGNVIRTLSKVKEPLRTIFVACEEDMEEAMLAAKRGVWSFSSDWFMSCIMRQELDMEAPQFAESL